MKKSFCTLVFSVFAVVLFAQENEGQKVKTKPEKVTLFVRGAQVDSKGNSPLKVGTQTIVFDNLSNFIDPNSVQVKANADITILSVNYQLNYLEPQNNPEYKRLEDSVKICKKEIARVA